MLGRRPRPKPDASAAYAVVWTNLRRQFPEARTILITSASPADDGAAGALGLAQAAGRLDGASGLVLVLDSAMRRRRIPDAPAGNFRIIVALTPAQVRTVLTEAADQIPYVLIVAPPPQHGPDCLTVAGGADAAILVATEGKTHFHEAQEAAELLRQAGVMTVAALLLTRRSLAARKAQEPDGASEADIADLRSHTQRKDNRKTAVGIEVLS
jgi:Mrp family chromosome partitioning ATPase